MKRFLTILMAAVMAAFTLAACANPSPNEALSKLLAVAPESEKPALTAEIVRLCGHHKNSEIPKSCDPAAATANIDLPDAGSSGVLQVLADVPQESLPVVVNLYLSYVASEQTTPDLPNVTLDPARSEGDARAAAITAAKAALEAEYAFDCAEKLREALGDQAPARLPAYTFNQPLPTDSATAQSFLTELTKELDALHVHDAEAATTPAWRLLSLSIAGYLRAK